MPDIPEFDNANPLGTPFRAEVPPEDFDRIHEAKKNIAIAKEIFDSPSEKPIVASVIQEMLVHPETPNEAKMGLFEAQLDLLHSEREAFSNIELAESLIDSIRAQKDPGIRIRLASILSQSLSIDDVSNFTTQQAIKTHFARRAAFDNLSSGMSSRKHYETWSRYVLEPKGLLLIFNELRRRESDLIMTPKIIEEITEESSSLETESPQTDEQLIFTGDIVRLKPPALPTLEKMVQYREETGRDLPLYIVRKEGGKFVSVQFPSDLTSQATDLVRNFRLNGEDPHTRRTILETAEQLGEEFKRRLNPEQRAEIENGANVEVRFSTTRDARANTPEPSESQVTPISPSDETPNGEENVAAK